MKKIILAASVLALSLSFSSCSKKSSDPAPTLTPLQILQSHPWKLSSTKMMGVESIEECEKDDVTTFKTDLTYSEDAGSVKCDPSDSQTETGAYALSSDGKTLTLDGDELTVVTLTDSKLEISASIGGLTVSAVFVK